VHVATLQVGGVGQLAGVKQATHMPLALQNGVLLGQSMHCTPLMPQVSFPLVWHVPTFPGPLEQQPLGQLAAVQTQSPLTQTLPAGHAVHCSPPIPQVVFELVWHVPGLPGPLEQQPVGQLAALQTQSPSTQLFPAGQAKQISPPSPQLSLVFPAKQGPVGVSQQPFGQPVALQTQLPAEQVSPAGHASHSSPPVPQFVLVLPARQTPTLPGPLEQHPVGQLSSLQTQFPPTHVVPSGQISQVSPPVPQS
jgi:hypothetical protein